MITLNHARAVLLQGEALALIRAAIRDKSIDLIATDPPYGEHTHAMMGKDRRYDGRKTSEELWFPPLTREFVEALAVEFVRVCKGWIIIFTDDRTQGWWGDAIIAAGGSWVRTGHWVKTNPKPQMTADRPSVGTEPIVIAHATGKAMEWFGGGRSSVFRGPPDEPIPDVWRGNRDTDGLHPNQKPLWLMQELLGLFGPAGSVVLDPFIGSGSTAVAGLARERIPGLVPVDLECKACAKKHVEHIEKRPPVPNGFSFIGMEGHVPTLAVAKQRLELALQGV